MLRLGITPWANEGGAEVMVKRGLWLKILRAGNKEDLVIDGLWRLMPVWERKQLGGDYRVGGSEDGCQRAVLSSLFLVVLCVLCWVAQSCLTLCNPMDCSLPGSSGPWGFSRWEYWRGLPCPSPGGSSQPRDWTQVSHIAGRFFTVWATREALRNIQTCLMETLFFSADRPLGFPLFPWGWSPCLWQPQRLFQLRRSWRNSGEGYELNEFKDYLMKKEINQG